jgi:sRNA-binding carbon storage regulator CsrA
MLYITRKEGQSFYMALSADVDPNMKVSDLLQMPVKILIEEFHGGICKVGIEAPRVFNIAREEIWDDTKAMKVREL